MIEFIDWMLGWLVPVVVAVVGFAVLFGGLLVGVREIGHYLDQRTCAAFGVQANRTVKFSDYTYWTWECLTPAKNGKWISTDRLRDFE